MHQLERDRQVVFAVSGHDELALGAGANAMALHQQAHTFLVHPNASCQQFLVHARPAVLALNLGVDGSHLRKQGLIAVKPAGATSRPFVHPPTIETAFQQEIFNSLHAPLFWGVYLKPFQA